MSGLSIAGVPKLDSAEAVETFASELKAQTDKIDTLATTIKSGWSALSQLYHAPEEQLVLSAMDKPKAAANDLNSDTATVKGALDVYAGDLRTLAVQRAAVIAAIGAASTAWDKADAAEIANEGKPHSIKEGIGVQYAPGQSPPELAQKAETAALDKLTAFASALDAAQIKCANKIGAIWGMPPFKKGDEAHVDYAQKYGMSAEGYEAATKTGDVPWGSPRGWKDSATSGTYSMIGIGQDFKESFAGLGLLLGIGDDGKVEAARSGAGKLVVAGATYTSLPFFFSRSAQERQESASVLLSAGKGMLMWDQWDTSPAQAGGVVGFNVLATALTLGTAGAAKAGAGGLLKAMGVRGFGVNARSAGGLASLARRGGFGSLVKVPGARGLTELKTWARNSAYRTSDAASAARTGAGKAVTRGADGVRATLQNAADRVSPQYATAGARVPASARSRHDVSGTLYRQTNETTTGWPRDYRPGSFKSPDKHKSYTYDGDEDGTGMLGGPPAAARNTVVEVGITGTRRQSGERLDRSLMPDAGEAFGTGKAAGHLDANTAYVVRGRGTFYTDGNKNIVFAEPTRKTIGSSGGRLSRELMSTDLRNPQPGVTYRVDDYAYFKVNDQGLVDHVHVEDVQEYADTKRSATAQRKVAKGSAFDDEGGHLISRGRGGPREEINLVRMLADMNKGHGKYAKTGLRENDSWRAFERRIEQNKGGSVDIRPQWDMQYGRPESFDVTLMDSSGKKIFEDNIVNERYN